MVYNSVVYDGFDVLFVNGLRFESELEFVFDLDGCDYGEVDYYEC